MLHVRLQINDHRPGIVINNESKNPQILESNFSRAIKINFELISHNFIYSISQANEISLFISTTSF